MQPATTPEPANRFPDEVERLEAEQELEYLLAPLSKHCDELEAAPGLSAADRLLLDQLSGFINSVVSYAQTTDAMLAAYRQALERAERPYSQPVPTLEQALAQQQAPAERLAYWEAQPAYRLGFVRGHQKGQADTERKYQRLVSLYADHATLPPSPTYQPSPLVARVQRHLASPSMQAYAALPLATRQALANLKPGQWDALLQQQTPSPTTNGTF
ncbi:MAG: hypothetical protein ACRYFX_09325 [Janthinobacterium lividum]